MEEEVWWQNLFLEVLFLGIEECIYELMCIFDVFVMLFLYEGLLVVFVEVQVLGFLCIILDNIIDKVDVGFGFVMRLSFFELIGIWVEIIVRVVVVGRLKQEFIKGIFVKFGYDVQ